MPTCNIFQIQRLSVNDGDGIRSTVFFKGCRLRCRWCANPESWSPLPQLMFFAHKCTGCARCVASCPQHANRQEADGRITFTAELCQNCGRCQDICPSGARECIGQAMSVDAVLAEIKKDLLFYEASGGGVTFSGGEPLLHPAYLQELLSGCQQLGINTAVESCAAFDFDACRQLLPEFDQIFFDIKLMDAAKHRFFTGASNAEILTNIAQASQLNENIIVRVPTICGVNADTANFHAMCKFLTTQTTIKKVELLPYHKLGCEKMQALGLAAEVFAAPSVQQLKKLAAIIHSYGLLTVSYK